MKVIISVGGRFHLFYLAQQLLKRGYLQQLITSYPRFEVLKYDIPKEKVSSIIVKEFMQRGWDQLPSFLKHMYNPHFFINESFDKLALRHIQEADIFVGLSSFSLHSLRKAKKSGMITILERGSSHILYQLDILKEEFEKFGLKFHVTHPKIIEKELKEYEEADYITVPSLFAKRSFIDKGVNESKLIHVPYGVNLTEFRQVPKGDNIFRVIFAGSLSLQKGVQYLLKAFYDLKLPKSELLLIGNLTDEIKPFLKKYRGYYQWVGSKKQKDLYKYYSQGSVFVMPSIQEGLALVQLQAMSCGLPLICTTNSGGEDLIENGKEGFVVPIRDSKGLKEKILFFYDNPDKRVGMGQAACKKIQVGFSWDDYGEKIISNYKDILSKKWT